MMENKQDQSAEIRYIGPAVILKTKNGFLVKMTVVTEDEEKDIFFFVDENFNHRVWSQTELKDRVLDKREYNRLLKKGLRELPLKKEDPNFLLAAAIAEKVYADPYYGLTAIKDTVAHINAGNSNSGATLADFMKKAS